ncbi:bifunctional (p)ppGpp synthetase/guanosine-3',5'-bis(diphosphate) 3'-pyrophosphohydrolase [Hydrogenoanaerobacterium saccharovorans]|uniref:GTP diphosphokinase n=1 Tax=Hydrogenoanaerobacterium saccharovorans TaxID=474960 RepID=A0ABS2GLL2_9FIRM|nr:bifunctional (p)ppGpp synthetase/guanosine-3',5'-bis(diphosphate) 3'-pyrophosphohydrolase [Hydrogenoanaerobacterium saccharovorans]MBM6923370.1 bifunctional (p)ppGpp synthetase/guanosine-3',5'-bis(diphosphate) 3'-pyrophosphohydrolase [Hydrogenoanaerobacterium saccharovorans]
MEKVYTIDDLMQAIKESGRSYDTDRIMAAYQVAKEAHKDQRRRSGEPYISHPVAVAIILVGLGMDTETLVAALLHDVVEDTATTGESIEKQFGEDVALMVNGVTKLGQVPFSTREEQQAENVRKMLLAMAQDVRVIIIKLADRLHNMRTLESMPPQKQRDKSLETMEVYAPLAHRLGLKLVKEELEDTALRFLDPAAYSEIESQLILRKDERDKFLSMIRERLTERLNAEGMHFYLESRVKSIYGIYRKVYIQGRDFDEIFDVYALRVIVDTVNECYNVLGVVHDMFRPIPNRFKDYISTPKANMYQSLHTTVLDKEGIPFEIQIRTWDMHYIAEYGVAAHWKYKAGLSGKDSLEEKLAWVRQLLEAQQESDDVEDIVRTIKTDIAPEEVFVFTPKGDVISLPSGSTIIDFAYAIHSAVGNRMMGAKVDGRIMPIDTVVKTGMIIEIITGNTKGPNRDWLKVVKTSEARNKIRAWFKKEKREENIAAGREELEKEFRRSSISLTEQQEEEFLAYLAEKQQMKNVDDFLAAIGYGGISLAKIAPRIKTDYVKMFRTSEAEKAAQALPKLVQKKSKVSSGVIVEGLDSCLVKFAQCCNPLPGDEIIGFITRGSGVSIHKLDCPNVINSMKDPEQQSRWVAAEWADTTQREVFKSSIELLARDRGLLLAEVSITLNNMHVPLHALQARELKDGMTSVTLTLGTVNVEQLTNIMSNLRKIDGVVEVKRANQ